MKIEFKETMCMYFFSCMYGYLKHKLYSSLLVFQLDLDLEE